jgi:hypothetical protein
MLSERDMHMAASRAMCETLELQGDTRTQVREIDHWAYFPCVHSRSHFIEASVAAGFRLRGTSEPLGPWEMYGARVWHRDVPAEEAMEQITLLLYDLAFEAGGDYDGWETRVVS